MSLAWMPPLNGSFCAKTSPGCIVARGMSISKAASDSRRLAECMSVVAVELAIKRPRASSTAVEASALDRVRGIEATGLAVRPSAAVMSLSNKATQRRTLRKLGFPVPDFVATTRIDDVVAFAERHGWPVVVKLASGGYDGRGVWVVDDIDALALVPIDGRELVVEPRLLLEREIAVQVARRPTGDVVVYPVVETL